MTVFFFCFCFFYSGNIEGNKYGGALYFLFLLSVYTYVYCIVFSDVLSVHNALIYVV